MRFYFHRWTAFRPHKPRNHLLRLALGLLGLAVLALLLVFGLVVGLGMLLFAAARRLLRSSASAPAAAPSDVIEGEYTLVQKGEARLGLR